VVGWATEGGGGGTNSWRYRHQQPTSAKTITNDDSNSIATLRWQRRPKTSAARGINPTRL